MGVCAIYKHFSGFGSYTALKQNPRPARQQVTPAGKWLSSFASNRQLCLIRFRAQGMTPVLKSALSRRQMITLNVGPGIFLLNIILLGFATHRRDLTGGRRAHPRRFGSFRGFKSFTFPQHIIIHPPTINLLF